MNVRPGIVALLLLALVAPAFAGEPTPAAEPAAEAALPALDDALFAFVVEIAGTGYVVLQRPAPARPAEGAPATILSRSEVAVRWPAATKDLPADRAAWAGRAVTIHGTDGSVLCRATVADLHVLVWYEPHMTDSTRWERGDEEGPAPDEATFLREASERGSEDADWWLVGRVVPEAGQACAGAVWARAADRPAVPLAAAAVEPDAAFRKAGLKHLRGLAEWERIQSRYREERTDGKRSRRWDGHDGATPAVLVMAGPDDVRWVWAGAQVDEGCGYFAGSAWAVWEVRGGVRGTWTPLAASAEGTGWFRPVQAIDLDADRRPEFVGPRILVRPVGPAWAPVETVEPNSHDCPC